VTIFYFIRHCEPLRVGDDRTYPLSEKGMRDRVLVTEFLMGKRIEAVLSSPFKRAYDTVSEFAEFAGLDIEVVEDFRERAISDYWVDDFKAYMANQWNDFNFKLPGGECFAEVQARKVAAFKEILERNEDKNIAVGTHGTALSLLINYYDNSYGLAESYEMISKMPWAVKMEFDVLECARIEKIDLY